MKISIVAPVYNEKGNIRPFCERLRKVLSHLRNYEMIFVDDGSTDGSLKQLRGLAKSDRRIKVISFSRNFGHQAAITCGLDAAKGDAVVTIDTDLQDPPELILKMIEAWRSGAEVVYAKRRARRDGFLKKFTARAFYRILDRLSDTSIPVDTGDFRLMDKKVVQAMRSLREHSRFMRGLSSWVGFHQTAVEFDRDQRKSGKTHYPFRRMLKLALDGIFSFSHKPLKVASWLGIIATAGGLVYAGYVIYLKLAHPDRVVQGWTSLTVIVLLAAGVELVILGVIGEYLGRIYTEEQDRPLYIVSEKVNFK
ncbi:MAG: glycosyltransferase family 2 protein [Candidatus Berkelbacteria bacterium]|nr:glycosyltransferase family 2 protein [Candidatus Berkelbacteria bacterium]